jgi:hypothetical protein
MTYAKGNILTDVVTKYAIIVSSDQQLAGENTIAVRLRGKSRSS